PIVMASSADPVGLGLVASLAHPGGNVTGVSSIASQLIGKRLEILKEVTPDASRVAVLWNPSNPVNVPDWKATQEAAQALGFQLLSLEVRSPDEFDSKFAAAESQRPDTVFTIADPVILGGLKRIIEFAAKSRLPAMYHRTEFVNDGGLMAYATDFNDLYHRA